MNYQSITITALADCHIAEVVDLLLMQQHRQHSQDARLRGVQVRASLEEALVEHLSTNASSLVAIDSARRVRGYAHPSIWQLKENSILHSFLSVRNGVVQTLTLPNPTDTDADAVVSTLLSVLDIYWQDAHTSGDLFRWPSTDCWFNDALARHDFKLDSICALHPFEPFFASRPLPTSLQWPRTAHPQDEEALIALFQEELLFHERSTPFVRSSPQVLDAFRRKLERMWKGEGLEEGAPLVLVIEQENEIVGMVENTLLDIAISDEPGFTAPGRYWCIDNMSVREDLQGQGIGRLLLQTIEDVLAALQLHLNGYILWFNPDNPKAARFWSQLGFQPLWTTYQRLHQ